VHVTAVQAAGLQGLDDNQKVTYELETGRNGKDNATNIALV
jgi:CspA family cold shock protein